MGTGDILGVERHDCLPCPARQLCTTAKAGRRQLTIPPREVLEIQQANRAAQHDKDWQARYAVCAGVEGTISQAVDLDMLDRTRTSHIGRLDIVLAA